MNTVTGVNGISRRDLDAFDPGSRRGVEQRYCCPLPACADKPRTPAHRSLAVNLRTGLYHCHRCGASGLLAEYRTDDRRERRGAMTPSPSPKPAKPQPAVDWRDHLRGLLPFVDSPAESYVHGRGISRVFPLAAGAKYHPHWYGFGPAVVFPIRDQHGNLVAAQGRYLAPDAEPRMRTAGLVKLGVFQTPNALEQDTVIVTEAPIDALTLAQCGFPAIATCGAKTFPAWLPSACAGKRIFIAYDNDPAGNQGAESLYHALLALSIHPRRLKSPACDWNDYLQRYGEQALRMAMKKAAL